MFFKKQKVQPIKLTLDSKIIIYGKTFIVISIVKYDNTSSGSRVSLELVEEEKYYLDN